MLKLSAVKPLGYTSINGRSLSILAALRASRVCSMAAVTT